MPFVRNQKGNLTIMLLEPTISYDDYISFTEWETEADAETYEFTGVYREMVDKIKGMYSYDIQLRRYNIELTSAMHLQEAET
jgi:heme-degrading monooxygenase HmoA